MKKGLLTAMGLSAALFASAQQMIKNGLNDKAGVAIDDFSNTDKKDFANAKGDYGIYFWKDTVNNSFPYVTALVPDGSGLFDVKKAYTDGKCRVVKSRQVGSIDYTISQPIGIYQPLGFGFGTVKTSPTDSSKQFINLSGGGYLKARVDFKFDMDSLAKTESGYKVKISLEDIDGKLIDSYGPNGGTGDQWKDELYVAVGKDGSFTENVEDKILVEATNGVGYMEFNFGGGYGSKYSIISTSACPDPLPAVTGFDSTKVTGLQITVVAKKQHDKEDCYQKVTLTNAKVSITRVAVGNIALGNEDEQLFASKGFVAYPSPTEGGEVNFSATAENVKVYDVVGNVVFSAASASKVNVDSFSKGLYIVKSSKGSTRFVVK